ncbi:MAG: LysE family translocator [Tenacibaculum sp.]
MNLHTITDAFLIGIFMAFMIGPVFFMLIKTSILKGVRAAISFDLGVILADISFILIAYYGSKSLLDKLKDDPYMFLIGGLILIIYGLITYLDKSNKKIPKLSQTKIPKANSYFKLFFNGFFLNFINIGVLAGWLAIMFMVGSGLKMNSTAIFWYFSVIIIGYGLTDLLKILLAKQLKKKLNPVLIRKINRITGVFLIAFGVILILKTWSSFQSTYFNHN